MSQEQFKVIIVGGSITGLTLAHSLDRIGVDYTILEKRANIAVQEGASIGILPNGARVLDQLGLYNVIEQSTSPIRASHIHFPDGFHFTSSYPRRILESFGYPIVFLERRRLLEILYNALPEKTKVQVNKTVSDIEKCSEGGKYSVRVRTLDGNVYEGDLVVGADGVHSRTRSEMWRLSGSSQTGDVPSIPGTSVEYCCVFGISQGLSGLSVGEQVMHMYNGRALLVIPHKEELVFWFLVRKLDRKYQYSNAPRFTLEDAAEECLQVANAPIADGIQFEHVWNTRQAFNMVSLEENLFKAWSFGSVVCIGDSMHKRALDDN
ncbi:FAD binding domain-containing protein [Fusarium austroafricanum]|uniref:FAD binding domain-containing protein n=1 Tax=Fusarium austroafricanum TaxID=2364996 RepID=A0A8H4KDZ6_9HYPO|nr:FAD binding domain-containing protein [Fusarium austroafricanum]